MKTLSIVFPEEQAEHLQQMSHSLSLKRNENITLSRLIREALEQVYPIKEVKKPEQNK
jgi:lysyl-tRNA synthetase class II